MERKYYLYDPRTNVSTETDYGYLADLTGMSIGNLQTYKSRSLKIRSIGCYITDNKTTVKDRRTLYEKESFVDEMWLTISGSDGEFLISNYGRFKRVYKTVKSRLLLPSFRKQNGHIYVKVRINGLYKQYKVAHLVASHFIGRNKNNFSVHHKNGVKTDCFAGNLQYISKSRLGKLTGGMSASKAVVQLCPNKMTPIEEYRSAREAGRKMFMSYQTVLDNCHDRTELAAGRYKFMFLSDYESEEFV